MQRLPVRRHNHRRAHHRPAYAPPHDLNLAGGEAFLIVNDHDPKPLFYQFSAEYPGTFEWVYQQQGPEVWQVRVSKIAA